MALSRKAREELLAELDRAAQEIDSAGYRGLADKVDDCREALMVFGPDPKVESKVRSELGEVNAAFDRMEARKQARRADRPLPRRALDARRPPQRREGWDRGDADASYKELRREKGMPDIGKGNKQASLRTARMERLGLNTRDVQRARHLALDRFLD